MGNPNSKGEISIKCTPEEMVKHFFKGYVIVWHDPNVNNQENQQYIAKFKKSCEVVTFTEWEKAKDYIQATQAICHVITSGTNGELLVNGIFESENVCNIYVFCGNKEYHSTWARNYDKVSCIETKIQNVLSQIQQNLLESYKKTSSLTLNLPAFAPISSNPLHCDSKAVSNFKNREQAKQDFLALSKGIYTDPTNAKLLEQFETTYNEYNKEEILRWYTPGTFLYEVTNNCLGIGTPDSIQYCRLALKDIDMAIKEQYHTKSKNFNGLLYRGAYLSEKEWSTLKDSQDQEIEMHGFLSVSKEPNVALNFMQTNPDKKVFITIIVPKGPNEEEQGFAEIEEFSQFPTKEEILFNFRSRFTVLDTEDLPYRHLILLYGAQGFRKYTSEENPTQEVSISSLNSIVCARCKVPNSGELFFISLADPQKHVYYCKNCAGDGVSPLLCVSPKARESDLIKVNGCLLMNSSQQQPPFYGYKCCHCQTKKQKAYFICTECEGKIKKWCENCFDKTSACIEAGHNIILETSPFSFWIEKTSLNQIKHLKSKDINIAASYNKRGQVYYNQGEYLKALECFLKSLDIRKSIYEDSHPALGPSYNNVGSVYEKLGELKKALEYHLKSLDINTSAYGENHPEVATSYNNIGLVYYNQGEYKKAIEYHLKSLSIYKSTLEENHPLIANSYNNIGLGYDKRGEYKKALECHLKSLDIKKSLYGGDNHPEIGVSFNNIGLTYYNQGEYRKALEYYWKSLDMYKSAYEENHPAVATAINNIGMAYDKLGEHKKALEHHLKSLDIKKSLYGGDNHPEIALSYNNVGLAYQNQGEYTKALEYYSKCLNIQEAVNGDNHPDTGNYYNNIGSVHKLQGNSKKALEYFLKSLNILKSVYGDNHSSVVLLYSNIGQMYGKEKEYKKSLEYYLKCLDLSKSVYRDHHPNIGIFLHNIGSAYKNLGDYNKALEYFLKSLDIYKPIYGDNHPEIASTYKSIGNTYKSQGEDNKAREYYLKCLEAEKALYGDNHPKTINTQNQILKIQSIDQNKQS